MEIKAQTSESNSRWFRIKKKFKKVMIYSCVALVFILATSTYWKFYYTYSEGFRTGVLQNFMHKGYVFKTYEGEILMVGNSTTLINSEKFSFSVVDKEVCNKLDTLQGQQIMLHYQQKNGNLFWRGESVYIVDSVKIK